MRMMRKDRRALRRIGRELRREDPLLASMLGEDDKPGGHHPEIGKARRQRVDAAVRRRSSYTPLIMF